MSTFYPVHSLFYQAKTWNDTFILFKDPWKITYVFSWCRCCALHFPYLSLFGYASIRSQNSQNPLTSEFAHHYYFLILGHPETALESFASKLYLMKQYLLRGSPTKIFFHIFRHRGAFCGLNWRIWRAKKHFVSLLRRKKSKRKNLR